MNNSDSYDNQIDAAGVKNIHERFLNRIKNPANEGSACDSETTFSDELSLEDDSQSPSKTLETVSDEDKAFFDNFSKILPSKTPSSATNPNPATSSLGPPKSKTSNLDTEKLGSKALETKHSETQTANHHPPETQTLNPQKVSIESIASKSINSKTENADNLIIKKPHEKKEKGGRADSKKFMFIGISMLLLLSVAIVAIVMVLKATGILNSSSDDLAQDSTTINSAPADASLPVATDNEVNSLPPLTAETKTAAAPTTTTPEPINTPETVENVVVNSTDENSDKAASKKAVTSKISEKQETAISNNTEIKSEISIDDFKEEAQSTLYRETSD